MLKTMVLAASLLVAIVVVAQNPTPSIRVDVRLVTLDVTVSDAAGRPVTNLTQQEFQIFEDGQPQEIRTFSPVESPYSILLLIDRSTSMENHWPLMDPAIAHFVANLKPQDRISIGAFDERSKKVELLLDWRKAENGSSIQFAINPVTRGNPYYVISSVDMRPGDTGGFYVRSPVKDFYAALDWSMQRLADVGGRKGVLVFTDGRQPGAPTKVTTVDGVRYPYLVDAQDDGDFRKLLHSVQGSKARFDFVAVNTDRNPAGDPLQFSLPFEPPLTFGMSVRSRLEQLTAISGGRVALPKRPEETVKLYENIAHELGTSYTLGYSPGAPTLKDGRYHRVEVRSTREGLKVQQSRDGYMGR
jgi:VWFA-related protein